MRNVPELSNRRRSRAGKALTVTAAVVVLAAVAGTAVSLSSASGRAAPQPARSQEGTADVGVARKMSFDITTTATGELEARNQIELRSRLERPSTIVEIVAEGTRVKAGDVLVRLNADDIQTQIEEETSRVEAARAELVNAENAFAIQKSENESKLRKARLDVELAKLALKQWENGEVQQKKQDLELDLDNTEKELVRLTEKYENSKKLFEREFLSKNELQLDEISLRRAKAEREKAVLANQTYWDFEHPKDKKTRESDVAEAEAEVDRVIKTNESQLAQKEANLKNARNQLSSRENRLSRLQQQFEAATIKAPSDGLVVYTTSTERGRGGWGGQTSTLQIGTQVQPNQSLIILPDTSEMRAAVRVHESFAGRIRPGMPASIRVEAVGKSFSGQVESIGVLAETGGWRDPNLREYTVRISMSGDVSALKPSMQCETQILLGRVEEALSVPVQAAFMDGAVRFVYEPRGNRFVRVPVRLGRRSDMFAEVLQGLDEGDRVLVRQPAPGEVLAGDWDKAQLELAGYQMNDKGQVVDPAAERAMTLTAFPAGAMPPGAGGPPGAAQGMPGGMPQGAGRPAGMPEGARERQRRPRPAGDEGQQPQPSEGERPAPPPATGKTK